MKIRKPVLFVCAALLPLAWVEGQTALFPNPARVIGQQSLNLWSNSPNLVEGRELYGPAGIALDTSVSPPILYVSDPGNNRVLAWRDSAAFANGAYADAVIGQRDFLHTTRQGPGTTFSQGLDSPGALAVDAQGNLYVVDTGNNRILRYPKPFDPVAQPDPVKLADRVIGQQNFTSRAVNAGGVSESSMSLSGNELGQVTLLATGLVFWTDAANNAYLYFTDSGNSRVLRYPVASIQQGNGARADVVLGQPAMDSSTPNVVTPQALLDKTSRLRFPHGVGVDGAGRVYVSDGLYVTGTTRYPGRVLVYPANPGNSAAAVRLLGIPPQGQSGPTSESTLYYPQGILAIGNKLAVADGGDNRILIYDPFEMWPAEVATNPSPPAKQVIGQSSFTTNKAAAGDSGLSVPTQAAVAGNELFVADTGNNRVLVFPQPYQRASRVLGQIGFEYNSPNLIDGRETFFAAGTAGFAGIAVDMNSDPHHLYVADYGNHRILGFRDVRNCRPGDKADLVIGQPSLFSAVRNYTTDGLNGVNDSNLSGPVALAVDRDGNLYAADSGNARVLRFPKPFDSPGTLPRANLVLGQRDFFTKNTDPSERSTAFPAGLAFTPDGHLLVSDAAMNRVLLFRKDGGDFSSNMRASTVFGQPDFTSVGKGADLNRLSAPLGIATDTSSRLYVADGGNNRVLVFSDVTAAAASDARAALPLSGLRAPQAVAVSAATGELWVGEAGANRITRFPEFSTLLGSPAGTVVVATGSSTVPSFPLAVALDATDNLLVAESANRISMYFPPLWAQNGANFLPSLSIQASLGRPCCAPGMIGTLWPLSGKATFGNIDEAVATAVPLPRMLSDIQVLVSAPGMVETAAPLYYVGSGQINFQVPVNAPTNGNVDIVVVRRSTGEVLAASVTGPNANILGLVVMASASPGLFTNGFATGVTGAVQVAALNQDNSCNGREGTQADARFCPNGVRPAKPGEVIQLFANGQGAVNNGPGNGEVGSGQPTDLKPRVFIGTDWAEDLQFSGLAPNLAGVWQINVRVPEKVATGPQPLFIQYKDVNSNSPTTAGKPAWPFTVIQVKR